MIMGNGSFYCAKCGSRWASPHVAHAGQCCCLLFATSDALGRHRVNGTCVDPTSLGMHLLINSKHPQNGPVYTYHPAGSFGYVEIPLERAA